MASLRELLGLVGAFEWRKKGVEIPALGGPGHNRIHPHYGVFAPIRSEYVGLVAEAPLPTPVPAMAFDIGTGTGVLAAILSNRGIGRAIAERMASEGYAALSVLPAAPPRVAAPAKARPVVVVSEASVKVRPMVIDAIE